MEARFEPVNLTAFTIDLASHFRSAIEHAQLQFIVNCEELKEPVYIDKDMWEKIVINLLSNAFKYTLKGSITLALKAAGENVELSVSDTGCGIPNHELSKIFERFYRVKGIQGRTHEGTGIGLALVQELVKLQSGSIRVESQLEVGTRFIVTLPFGNKHHVTNSINSKKEYSQVYTKAFVEEALGLTFTPSENELNVHLEEQENVELERIIIAEDNADMRKYLFNLLSEHYNVSTFENGKEALEASINHPPNLILSDVMMPVMDGLELIKQVRSIKPIHETPIILLSARANQESLIGGIDTGADDYLIKPFSAKELLARINHHILMQKIRQESNQQKK
jgi:CheY-like chemotaxis protein